MSFECVKDIRRWSDENIESVGRDILRAQAHKLADSVSETIDKICRHYDSRIAKQAGVLAETADRNVRIEKENKIIRHIIGLDICCDCISCEDEINIKCPFAGEPCGCNNRDCQQAYKLINSIES